MIKTAEERIAVEGVYHHSDRALNTVTVSLAKYHAMTEEAAELRAAYEALQKENAELRDRITIMDEAAKYYNETIIGISNKLHAQNEALKLKKEFIEYAAQDLENQNEALKAENEAIQKELTHWKANHADLKERLHVATHRTDLPSDRLPLFDRLKAENEAQAKSIAELEEHVTKLGSGSRQHLYKAFARRYKEILSLRKENEALHKQVDEHNEWHMMRDEMRKALEAQMNGDSK